MLFSQRQGLKPIRSVIQINSIDEDLSNMLWNVILESFFLKFSDYKPGYDPQSNRGEMCMIIWKEFFKQPIDKISTYVHSNIVSTDGFISNLRSWYFNKATWNEKYDIIEFISNVEINFVGVSNLEIQANFIQHCNNVLKKECAGYRLIENRITQITAEEEIVTIEEAISKNGKLQLVSLHLKTALDLLADRKNPDYRNSIKESISGVESLVKLISGNPNDSLGGAIDKIKGKIKIHQSLERGFKQIYGYTSDADGIRHGLKDMADCDFEDAKFMLVSCSAFINYLIAKSAKAGVTFE